MQTMPAGCTCLLERRCWKSADWRFRTTSSPWSGACRASTQSITSIWGRNTKATEQCRLCSRGPARCFQHCFRSPYMNIVISEFMDAAAVDVLRKHFDVVYDPELVDRPEALRAALPGAHAWIVRNRSQVDESMLAIAPALKVVGRLGVGLDNIAVRACQSRNIAVIPA